MATLSRNGSPATWLAALVLALVVAVPMAFIILQAVFPDFSRGSLTLPFSRFGAMAGDPALIRMLANTFVLGVAVCALSAAIAVPLAILRAMFEMPFARLWDVLLLVPFMIPPYIATLGWIMTLQPGGYLQQLAGIHLSGFLYSFAGIVFVMSLNTFPLVYFAVSRTLAAVGGRYADFGRVAGAAPLRAFWRITLPLSTPGLAASLLLVFAAAIEEYGTPAALGRQAGIEVLVTGIETRVSDWPIDLAGASVLSLTLAILALGAFALQRFILSRRNYETLGGKPQAHRRARLGIWTIPALIAFALATLLATFVPLLAILATALSKTLSGGLALDNLGFQNFAAIGADGAGALKALRNSLLLGVAAALVTGLLGAIASYAVVKTRFRGRGALDALAALPNALPGVVVAVGLILAWNQPWLPLSPYDTPAILLLAYCCILLPFPVRYTNAALHQISDNLEAAARVFGASPFTAFRRILLPLIAPSLIAAMLLVFAIAARELVASIMLAPVGMQTISTFIWRQFDQGSVGLGMAMAFAAILITTILPLVILRVMKQGPIV